jgi:hypothetical protein
MELAANLRNLLATELAHASTSFATPKDLKDFTFAL